MPTIGFVSLTCIADAVASAVIFARPSAMANLSQLPRSIMINQTQTCALTINLMRILLIPREEPFLEHGDTRHPQTLGSGKALS